MQKLQGIAVSPGVAIGEALVMDTEGFRIPRRFVARDAVVDEMERLDKAIAAAASGKATSNAAQEVPILRNCKGVLRPGTTTLLLAPPGHGKTSFLKALAGRVPAKALEGSISYSGVDQSQLRQQGVFIQARSRALLPIGPLPAVRLRRLHLVVSLRH